MQNFLGIDWGESKIGVALGHQETGVAVAYQTLPNDENTAAALRAVVEREGVQQILVGVPRRVGIAFKDQPAVRFGQRIESVTGCPVAYSDESFTTKLAQDTLKLQGEKQAHIKDDAEAARILLQDWMDREPRR